MSSVKTGEFLIAFANIMHMSSRKSQNVTHLIFIGVITNQLDTYFVILLNGITRMTIHKTKLDGGWLRISMNLERSY